VETAAAVLLPLTAAADGAADLPARAAAAGWMLRQTDACWSSNLVLITQMGFVMKQTCDTP